MIYDERNQTVGSFTENPNLQFNQCLTKLSESFEDKGIDFIEDIQKISKTRQLWESYKEILMEDYIADGKSYNSKFHDLNVKKMEQLLENSRQQVLSEAGASALNPVVALTFPLLKRNWVSCVMKDIVPTEVATSPVVRKSIEKPYIQDMNGVKHYLPEALNGTADTVLGFVRKPLKATTISVPTVDNATGEIGINLITESTGSLLQGDEIARNFYIASATIKVESSDPADTTGYREVEVTGLRIKADTATGIYSQAVSAKGIGTHATTTYTDILQGSINYETGLFTASSIRGLVTGVKVKGYLSAENNMYSASTGWDREDHVVEIPTGIHLNTGLTEERLRNSKILFNIDETTKAIHDMTRILNHIKDIDILKFLDDSKERLANTDCFISTTFNCKPPSSYVGEPQRWRTTELKETLDRLATKLRQILKTENIYFAVFGNPLDVRLLDGVNWTYSDESVVGGVKTGYSFGIMNSMNKYFVTSSERIPEGKLRLIVVPTNDEHIVYKHFEYSFIIANNYRDPKNPNVPSVMVTSMYATDEVVPIQGEIVLQNNTISSTEIYA